MTFCLRFYLILLILSYFTYDSNINEKFLNFKISSLNDIDFHVPYEEASKS